jgi:hypothetical protein
MVSEKATYKLTLSPLPLEAVHVWRLGLNSGLAGQAEFEFFSLTWQ